jgi:DNA-binding CsgD family transcriptional regulator
VHRAFELTEREREVCRRLAAGQAPPEIAGALQIKTDSVYRYLVTIREKLEVPHLVALVAKVCKEEL